MPIPLLVPLTILIAGAIGGGALTAGAILQKSFEGKIFELLKIRMPNYPKGYNISESLVFNFISKWRNEIVSGYKFPQTAKDVIDLSKKIINLMNIETVPVQQGLKVTGLALWEQIKPSDGDLYSYLRGGATDADYKKSMIPNLKEPFDMAGTYLKWIVAGLAIYALTPLLRRAK